MQEFNPEEFVNEQVVEIRELVGSEKALIAVSGGVDSTTCAALAHRALGEDLLCVMLDDAFMRANEPEQVRKLLSQPPLSLPVEIVEVRERFLNALKGLRNAEEKRKAFREAFYKTLSETAEKESCRFLVQGTIQADIVETTRGVKTQHNILSQVGISPKEKYGFQVIEPLALLYKPQVRRVARFFNVPSEISERQPFPGPGLSVRVVGEIRSDKLESLKKATSKTERKLAKHQPEQYFAAILDNLEKPAHPRLASIIEIVTSFFKVPAEEVSVKAFRDKATGIRKDRRHYGEILAIKVQRSDGSNRQFPVGKLVVLQNRILAENQSFTRVLYAIKEKPDKKPYSIVIRAIKTRDFLTAKVADIPWTTLSASAQEILQECGNVSEVYFDVTPKPPATIEME